MKKWTLIILIILGCFSSVNLRAQCDDGLIAEVADALGNFNYMKDYKVRMEKMKKKNKMPPQISYSIILNEGKKYRFIINYAEDLPGKLKFEMFGQRSGIVLTNYDGLSNKYYNGVEFQCKATAMYTVSLSFSDGQEGCGVVIVGFDEVKKNKYHSYFKNQ